MISHDRAEEFISARLDAPLTPAEHRELQSHLATCAACRIFAGHNDEFMHGLQTLPRLAPSPAVSRGVMAAISTEETGWGWLGRILQTLSSPGLAVASGLALVVVLSGALFVALNAPNDANKGTEPESTIAAAAFAPLPTEAPTLVPTELPTEVPTAAPTVAATKENNRTIQPAPTVAAKKTPTPEPTATQPPIQLVEATEAPLLASTDTLTVSDSPPIEAAADDPTLAMAPEDTTAPAEMAQGADAAPADAAPSDAVAEDAAPSDSSGGQDGGSRKGGRKNSSGKDGGGGEAAAADAPQGEAPPAESAPVPDESIAALVTQGDVPDVNLPPAAPPPMAPMAPDQSFLPETPTPTTDGTPTPEADGQTDVPQLAEDTSGQLGVTALAPDVTDSTTVDEGKDKNKDKRDKSGKDGNSSESQQKAFTAQAMGWSSQPIDFSQPNVLYQTTDDGAYDSTGTTDDTAGTTGQSPTGEAIDPTTGYEIDPTTGYPIDPETGLPFDPATGNLIDPATGLAIDPVTGLLIDPATGYLLDLANHRIIDPKTGFEVHPITGLLIDPVTGAQLDPVTHAVVIPAGFGSDQPDYQPGSDMMRGEIESVVDNTYDSATIKLEPPTDGPSQPVDPINIAPTESGDAVEIS
jgi:hypothetical protein